MKNVCKFDRQYFKNAKMMQNITQAYQVWVKLLAFSAFDNSNLFILFLGRHPLHVGDPCSLRRLGRGENQGIFFYNFR